MIKHKLTYSILLLIAFFNTSFAQNDVTGQLMLHVTSADYRGVSDLCSEFVEIQTDKYEETTSKSQVGFILKEFFAHYPPRDFVYNHVGTSPGGAKYVIASYFCKQGKEFLVVVKFKLHGGKLLIDTIKFTAE
tara:strand:- start:500 stop:898 length:399 start_codon:yes stop_codon:yes gene_type:complete